MMGKRLERFGEVRIVDETNGFGLDFVEKTESTQNLMINPSSDFSIFLSPGVP